MPLRTRFWIISLCALLAACQPGLQTPPLDYSSSYEQAERYLGREMFSDAGRELTLLTRTYPQRPEPWRLLGGLHDLQQHPAKAHEIFTQGLATVSPATPGFADLALQSALLCVNQPQLECHPEQQISRLPADDPRHQVIVAAREVQAGHDVKALKLVISLLQQPLPKSIASDIYLIAAQIYKRMDEPLYVNESLFHAVNFAKSPILVLRIEQLWKPKP